MLTPALLETFIARYNLCVPEPVYLSNILGTHRFSCRTFAGERFEIFHDHIQFPGQKWREDPRILATFPDETRRDNFSLSAVVYLRVQDLSREAPQGDLDPAKTILLLTVHGWLYDGVFSPDGYVFVKMQTPFREVWVWTADQKNCFRCSELFLNCLKPEWIFLRLTKSFREVD